MEVDAGPSTSEEVPAVPLGDVQPPADGPTAGPSTQKRPRRPDPEDEEPMSELLLRRVTRIKEGDNVLLRLPSDSIKAVVAAKEGLLQLGKYGAVPASQLLGLHYDITYEIAPSTDRSRPVTPAEGINGEADGPLQQGNSKKSKKEKGKAKENVPHSHPGWSNVLRPLKRQPIVEAVLDDVRETNEFIDDTEDARQALLSQEEILNLRAQGISAEEMIRLQMARHERFELKTDFSKEKWRKRKEKKYSQSITPMAPSIPNILKHYSERSPQSILHLRDDTMSQMLVVSNVRPEGRYLMVDDTGGLVTAAVLERMGAEGRILTFTENDSPPAWGVLQTMNFGSRELECIKSINWMEAEEGYQRPPPPLDDENGEISAQKIQSKLRRYNGQVKELNGIRDELHRGNWDGLIIASELSPISIVSRLLPYLAGSATITVYSPYLQVLAELLQFAKKDPRFLGPALTESWTRTYQVLPGRTHPMMMTSATGGSIFHAHRIHPGTFEPGSKQIYRKQKIKPEIGDGTRRESSPTTTPTSMS